MSAFRRLLPIFVIFVLLHKNRGDILEPIDLTWGFDNNTIYWGNTQRFNFTKKTARYIGNTTWYAANEFCAGEHGGTHFDAPYHFYENGWKVGDVPLSRLIAPGVVIDVSEETEALGAEMVLRKSHLEKWENDYGTLPSGCVVLVRFGWSKYYNNVTKYMGANLMRSLNFPGVSLEAAKWIIASKKVFGVGLDTASIDPGSSTDFAAHKAVSKNQIYILENVKIPATLPATGFMLYVLPMKITEGTGAPVRIVASPVQGRDRVPWFGHVAVITSCLVLLGTFLYNADDYEQYF